ncbi:MAG: chloride channel protein, partial [Terriglobales bacterium]
MTGTGTAANPGTGSHPSLPADGSTLKSGSRSWFTLSTSREERFFLLLAVFIGLFSGLAVVCFRLAIDWTRISLLGPAPELHSWRLIATPTLVGLVMALLVVHVFPLVRGSGVNQTKAALYIYNGYIPFRTAVGKFITAAMAIGSGQSLGPEDPSLQIGASLASA